MHDIKEIAKNPESFADALKRRNHQIDIHYLVSLHDQVRKIAGDIDNLRARRNEVSQLIGESKRNKNSDIDVSVLSTESKEIGVSLKQLEDKRVDIESMLNDELLHIPNLPSINTPDGLSAKDNVLVREAGAKQVFEFTPRDHLEIAERLNLLDFPRGGKITGSGFPIWTGWGAKLERALLNFMLDLHTFEHGYQEMMTPFMANRASMTGTGQIPHLEDDMYRMEKDDLFMIPTSEVTLVNLHRDDLLNESDLPLKYVAYSPNFRREAGAYGAATRGFLRVHQFNKVELVRFEKPERSSEVLEEIVSHATRILDLLEIPYRVLKLCAGDMAFQAAMCYDIEVWAPGTEGGKYLETSSCSNCEDFQSRRANIRYRPFGGGKPVYPHTLNGSALATSRLLVAILENYQTEEGSLIVPEVLRKYLNGQTVITAETEKV
ncbi:serine--tRNA ligase [Calditrichota bacterium]